MRPMAARKEQDQRILGPGLGPDPARSDQIAIDRRTIPHRRGRRGRRDRRGRIGLIDDTVEELQVAREDVIDLEDHRAQEQDQEPVVEGSVRQPGPGITHQRLHQSPPPRARIRCPQPGAAVVGPERPARGPTGEEVEQ